MQNGKSCVVWANDRVNSKKASYCKKKMDWTQSTIKTILGRLVGKGVLNTKSKKVESLFNRH